MRYLLLAGSFGEIDLEVGDGSVALKRKDDKSESRAAHGLARALVANMVRGVTEPFVKELEIQGVGYRADMEGKTLERIKAATGG